MTLLLKMLASNGIPVKISKAIFAVKKKKKLQFTGNLKGPQTVEILLKQKMEAVLFTIQNILQSNQDDVVLA